MIPSYQKLSGEPYSYAKYLRLQKRLRKRRRELVVFCQHPPTLTAGVQHRSDSLLSTPEKLREEGVVLHGIGRGGDFTAHEPGQCVIYPHIDLKKRSLGISDVFHSLLVITLLAIECTWGIRVKMKKDAPGLYLEQLDGAKLVSIGVLFKSFFTSFGLAVNVSNDLSTFRHIHPCGYADLEMTSVVKNGGDPDRLPMFIESWMRELQNWLERGGH